MTVSIALSGKPNTGKSTFFKAATLVDVEIANYPFTTVGANLGVTYVRVTMPVHGTKCQVRELHKRCALCAC